MNINEFEFANKALNNLLPIGLSILKKQKYFRGAKKRAPATHRGKLISDLSPRRTDQLYLARGVTRDLIFSFYVSTLNFKDLGMSIAFNLKGDNLQIANTWLWEDKEGVNIFKAHLPEFAYEMCTAKYGNVIDLNPNSNTALDKPGE